VETLHLAVAAAFPAAVALFMAANLAAVGLELDVRTALVPLRSARFVASVLAWNCLLGPAFAWLLAILVPMARPYAVGLLLVGMTPGAPFLPTVVRRARGDVAAAAAFLLLAAAGTVVFMPLALATLVPNLSVDAWTIARPLLLLLLAPLLLGLALRLRLPGLAERLQGRVKRLGDASTVVLLAMILVLDLDGILAAVGSHAIAALLLFVAGVTAGSYVLGRVLPRDQRDVLSLGVCTRNLGAAVAPLMVLQGDPRSVVMVALAVPITLAMAFAAAHCMRRQATT
jgi:BASS family bile acid:Na+ symporter